MKTFLILLFTFNVLQVEAQINESLRVEISKIYSEEADSYLKDFAKNRYPSDSELDQLTRYSIYKGFLTDIMKIESDVKNLLIKNPKSTNDKGYIAKLLGSEYANNFPGLPKEFWDSVNRRVKMLGN